MTDPVRARRIQVYKAMRLAKRVAYLCFLASIAAVAYGLLVELTGLVTGIATAFLLLGSVLLAPAVIIGYSINAAEREDRAAGYLPE